VNELEKIQAALMEKDPPIYELPEHILHMGKPWLLQGDYMVVGDIHSPTTNWEFASLVAKIAVKYLKKPRKLIIAGDLFNADAFSFYTPVMEMPSWAQERDATRALITEWMKTFEEIRLIVGNHERRLQRFTAGAFDTADILSLIVSNPDRVKMSAFSFCVITTPGGEWRVTHPGRYRQNPLSVAGDIALIRKQNVIAFHEHHIGMTMDKSGNYVVVNGGSLANPNLIPYMALIDDTKPSSKTGFVMLKNGAPYIFGPAPLTDWSHWL